MRPLFRLGGRLSRRALLGPGQHPGRGSGGDGYAIHRLTYLRSEPDQLVRIDTAIAGELQQILHARGFYPGTVTGVCDVDMLRALHDFMGWENYDARIRDDDRIDLEVLADIRRKHALWCAGPGQAD